MKKVTVVIPTYNEEGNVEKMVETLTGIFENEIKNYDFEILFSVSGIIPTPWTVTSQLSFPSSPFVGI